MDPKTEVLRDIKGAENLSACDVPMTLGRSDIVAGNRYRGDEKEPFLLVPDSEGPWLALVTHRGENAPPRPATLPAGTRVRRGPDWRYNNQDVSAGNLGTVIRQDSEEKYVPGVWLRVRWDNTDRLAGHEDVYRWGGGAKGNFYDLEVVSLPAEAAHHTLPAKTPGLVTPAEYAAETPAFKVGDWVRLRDDVTPAMLARCQGRSPLASSR